MTCTNETTMLDAEKLMHKHRIRHVPIVDGAKLVGMLSIRDVMVWRWQEFARGGQPAPRRGDRRAESLKRGSAAGDPTSP